MSRRALLTRRQAIEHDALFLLTAGDGNGYREHRIEGEPYFMPAADRNGFEAKLQAARILRGELSACPRTRKDSYLHAHSSCVWARIESTLQADSLSSFKVAPTLVLRDGETVKRTAFWWLDRELSPEWALRANERLARALGCARKHAALDFMFAPPGAREGVQLVQVERIGLEMYSPQQVVGGLRDAPDPEVIRLQIEKRQAEQQRVAA